jgi:tetratricopeptide (TPR) repeat protein
LDQSKRGVIGPLGCAGNMTEESRFEIQVDRNLDGIEFEKKGELKKAIRLYEKNIEEDFEGSHPYDRLAIIYRKRGEYEKEIRVLRKAIFVFENKIHSRRSDREPKLQQFRERLDKAMQKLEKAKEG